MTAVVVGAGLLTLGLGTPAAAPKTSNPGVTVTFGDRQGDRIWSDGHGAYVNGVGGVVGQIFVAASGDMTLNLNGTRPNRVFNGSYSPAGDVAQPTTNPPSGTFSDGGFLNIGRVWQIPVGTTVSTGASFNTGAGQFQWCADGEFCAGFATTEVVTVTRVSTSNWTVSADAATLTSPGSDLNALVKMLRGSWQALGYYRMPFQLTIQCQTALCQ